jgi:hypothetical protein
LELSSGRQVFKRNRLSVEKKKKEPLAPELSPALKTASLFLRTASELIISS